MAVVMGPGQQGHDDLTVFRDTTPLAAPLGVAVQVQVSIEAHSGADYTPDDLQGLGRLLAFGHGPSVG